MDDDAILSRTEELRRQLVLIQQEEHSYRTQRNHSFADMVERQKREFRVLAIREELKMLRDQRNAA